MPMLGAGGGGSAVDQAKAALAAAAAGGGGLSAVSQGPLIPVRGNLGSYLKPVNRGQFDGDIHTTGPAVKERAALSRHDELNPDAAIGAWYSFTDEDRDSLMKRMWYLGLTKSPTDFDSAFTVWKAAVSHAAGFAAAGKKVDPRDVIEMLADGKDGANGPNGSGYRQQRSVTRSIDLTDPATAKEWVQQAFHQSMGRKAEDAEVRALVDALHQQQRANPQITTTTPTRWDESGRATNTTTTTTGGVDPDAFFAARMAADPEAGAHQAAADLFPALMQALGGVG